MGKDDFSGLDELAEEVVADLNVLVAAVSDRVLGESNGSLVVLQ